MMEAGTYDRRFEWKKRTQGTGDSFGQKPDVFTSQGFLWGKVEELDSSPVEEQGRDRDERRAVVRLRNYPAVVAPDTLTDEQTGDVWEVLSVRRGRVELICEVKR